MSILNQLAEAWWTWMAPMFWQVGLLIVIVAVIDRLTAKKVWPQVAYALWLLVLVKLVLPPDVSSPASLTAHVFRDRGMEVDSLAMRARADMNAPAVIAPVASDASPTEFAPVPSDRDPVMVPQPKVRVSPSQRAYLMLAWWLGVVLLGLWAVLRYRSLRREYIGGGGGANPASLLDLLHSTARALRLRRVPELVFSSRLSSPAVFGVFRPVLVMPEEYRDREPDAATRHVLLHELAHIKRGDLWVHAFAVCLQIVYWFHPLLWLVHGRMRHLRELCCDATVGGVLREETSHYRETLLGTAERLLRPRAKFGIGWLGLVESPGGLATRLQWLERKVWQRRPLRIVTVALAVGAMTFAVLPMARPRADGVTPVEGKEIPDDHAASPADAAGSEDVSRKESPIERIEVEIEWYSRDSEASGKEKVTVERRGQDFVASRGNEVLAVFGGEVVQSFLRALSEMEKVAASPTCHPMARKELTAQGLSTGEAEALIREIREGGLVLDGLAEEDRAMLESEFQKGVEGVILEQVFQEAKPREESLEIKCALSSGSEIVLTCYSTLGPRFQYTDASGGTQEFADDVEVAPVVNRFLRRLGPDFEMTSLDIDRWRERILEVSRSPLVEKTRDYCRVYSKIRATPEVAPLFSSFIPVYFPFYGFRGSTVSRRDQPVEYQHSLHLQWREEPGLHVWIEAKTVDDEAFYGTPPASEVADLCRRVSEVEFIREFFETAGARLLLYLTKSAIGSRGMCSFRNDAGFGTSTYFDTESLVFEPWVMEFRHPPDFLDLSRIPAEAYSQRPLGEKTVVSAILRIVHDGTVEFVRWKRSKTEKDTKADETETQRSTSDKGEDTKRQLGKNRLQDVPLSAEARKTLGDSPMSSESRRKWEIVTKEAGLEGVIALIELPSVTGNVQGIPFDVYRIDGVVLRDRRISITVRADTGELLRWEGHRSVDGSQRPDKDPEEVRKRLEEIGDRLLPGGRKVVRGPGYTGTLTDGWFVVWAETKDGVPYECNQHIIQVDDEDMLLWLYEGYSYSPPPEDMTVNTKAGEAGRTAVSEVKKRLREETVALATSSEEYLVEVQGKPSLLIVPRCPEFTEGKEMPSLAERRQRRTHLAWEVKVETQVSGEMVDLMKRYPREGVFTTGVVPYQNHSWVDRDRLIRVWTLWVDTVTGKIVGGSVSQGMIVPMHSP